MAKKESVLAEPEQNTTPAESAAPTEPTFSGEQLIRAAKGISRDVMAATLSPGKRYTEAEAKTIVDKFLKKEVTPNGGR